MTVSEQWLLWRLRHGDRGACGELISRHYARVFGYLRHLGADRPLAEDLTQETYAKAWEKLPTLRRAGSLCAWLLTIARNEYLQRRRRKSIEVRAPEGAPDPPDPAPGTLERIEESEREAGLERALSKLEEPLREVVFLHYSLDLSQRDIGAHLGVPAGTVKSRIHRALEALRRLLEEEEKNHVRERTRTTIAETR